MTQPRHEMYRPIHKAMPHILFSTSEALGLADFRDEAAARDALDHLARTITFLREHAGHENDFVHPALESKVPGITANFADNHEDDEAAFEQFENLSQQIRSAGADQRIVLGNQVHDRFNVYIGEYLGHGAGPNFLA